MADEEAIRFTRREREVMEWAAEGKSAYAIGVILGISQHTVAFHLKRAAAKLGTSNKTKAVAESIRRGLIA